MPAKSTTKSAAEQAKPSRSSVTKAQLDQGAKLRGDGATWEEIRTATGAKLGSSGWFRAWEREGIEHVPAGQRVKPKAAPASEAAAAPKPKRTVRRSAKTEAKS